MPLGHYVQVLSTHCRIQAHTASRRTQDIYWQDAERQMYHHLVMKV